MKDAVIGSRSISQIDLSFYIPQATSEIVSGGAKGIDTLAADYANEHNIPLKVFLPEYQRFGRCAPLKRNERIVAYSDFILAFWDGESNGTKHVISLCQKFNKDFHIVRL